jgi:hypothetical protein
MQRDVRRSNEENEQETQEFLFVCNKKLFSSNKNLFSSNKKYFIFFRCNKKIFSCNKKSFHLGKLKIKIVLEEGGGRVPWGRQCSATPNYYIPVLAGY